MRPDGCVFCAEERKEVGRAVEQARQRKAAFAARLGGERALTFTRENFAVTDDNRAALEAAERFNYLADNLYLHGTCGTGKTHLAVMIAAATLANKLNAEYVQPGRLLRRVRGKTGAEEQAEIDRLAALDVFVLDDLGAEKDTEYAVQILYEVIDGRVMGYRNGLVVTSNLPLPELAKKLGDDRLPSRLAGLCKVIEITGSDWRLRAPGETHRSDYGD